MRYFGGGVGHLKNTPPQQAHRSDPVDRDLDDSDSEEMEVEGEEGNAGGNTRGDLQLEDIIQVMSNGELEVGEDEDDEEMGQDENDDEKEDDSDDIDNDDDGSDDEDDYGYGSP